MIQSIPEILYYARSQKSGKIRIELTNPIDDGVGNTTYTVTDWIVDEDPVSTIVGDIGEYKESK